MTLLKQNPLARMGRERSHAVPPRFISKTYWSWIHLFRLITGSTVHPTQWAALRPAPTFGGHAHGWFSLAHYRRRFSADDLLSLADSYQLLVPVNAILRLQNYTTLSTLFKRRGVCSEINSETPPTCHREWGSMKKPNQGRWLKFG